MQGQPFPHLRGAARAAGYGVFIFQPPGGVFRAAYSAALLRSGPMAATPACGAPSLLNSASMSSGSLTR